MGRITALLLMLCATVLHAQDWQAGRADGGHFVVHDAHANVAVRLLCFAPSTQGRPSMDVEQHEETPTARGFLRIEIGPERVPLGNAFSRGDVVIWADRTGYRLPMINWNEPHGHWEVDLAFTDPIWAALARARSMVLAPGQDQAWQLPTVGLRAAIADVTTGCAQSWEAAAAAQAPATGLTVPPAIPARVAQGCGVAAPIPQNALQAGDLDRDGRPDFILDWGAFTCPGTLPRPFCGAANCSQDVFLSTRGYSPPLDFLGTSLTIVPHRDGGLALMRTGNFSLCGAAGERCATPLVWDGASFVERP